MHHLLAPLVLAACVAAAPYEAPAAPEKLVEGHHAHAHHGRSVQCGVTYQVVWDTEYVEQPHQTCETVYEQQCHVTSERLCHNTTRQECQLVQDQVCNTVYTKLCTDHYKTVVEPYTETECTTEYRDDCEFHWEVQGGEKVWAVIPGTCKKNPYDECRDVQKTHQKQVAYQVCEDVPEEKCQYVNRQECYQVPDQVCKSEPITQCSEVPKQICKVHHKRVPVRVSRKVPKKVCNVPGQTTVTHTHPVHEFVPAPVPAVPVPAVPSTTAPSALDDILNRNEDTFEFGGNTVGAQENNSVDELDRFVFEEKSKNSTINFEQ